MLKDTVLGSKYKTDNLGGGMEGYLVFGSINVNISQ